MNISNRGATGLIIGVIALVIGLPFFLKARLGKEEIPDDAVRIVIVTPHNAAIRTAFAESFDAWHRTRHGTPAAIEWRLIGGTSEIIRYLDAEYRARDTAGIDLFFGGGAYDHTKADRLGILAEPWPADAQPPGLAFIPERLGGETWRTPRFFGTALSTFGICYNPDRLRDLGIEHAPVRWSDLADFRYFGHLGITDPTKSGSVAKTMEMVVHDQCLRAVFSAGYTLADIAAFEADLPAAPAAYHEAITRGFHAGLNLLRRLGANARTITDSAGKVPADVSTGLAAAGMVIDFFGRFQAELTRSPEGLERLIYRTPEGGSSVSADPIALLKNAPNREIAIRFLHFVLSEEGQMLWCYQPGTPGGPRSRALRRLPIRRDFYPGEGSAYERHRPYLQDELGDPAIDPYRLATAYPYVFRWTGPHFGLIRDLFRAMCIDSSTELKAAWVHFNTHPSPHFDALPPDLASPINTPLERRDALTRWSAFFRDSYRRALAAP